MISVILKSNTDDCLKNMVFAAKICYQKENEILTLEAQEELIKKILARRHWSILEHAILTFYITGVSRNFTHQLVRHRHMSFAQQSLHFTKATDLSIASTLCTPTDLQDTTKSILEAAYNLYFVLLNAKVPKEEARHVLPSGLLTKIVVTANLREWLTFIKLRTCSVNCEEIRIVAIEIAKILKQKFPFLGKYLGPNCFVEKKCYELKCKKAWEPL